MAKTIFGNIHAKKEKDETVLHKLMSNAVYGKTMENVRNRIDVQLLNNGKDYLKWKSNPSYMSQ